MTGRHNHGSDYGVAPKANENFGRRGISPKGEESAAMVGIATREKRIATRKGRRVNRGVLAILTLIGLTGSLLSAAPPATAAPAPPGRAGSLDTTFGSGGIATLSIPGMTLTPLGHVLVQPDGKLVVGGGAD